MRSPIAFAILAILLVSGCARAPIRPDSTTEDRPAASTTRKPAPAPQVEKGVASYYADVLHGRLTASGQPYDKNAETCAHKTHRFGTKLEVRVVDTGRKVVCRVNDRGPFVSGRIVDVSRALAARLGLLERGVARVEVRKVE